MTLWSSPMDTILETLIPNELSALDMCAEFVSVICPIRISSPIVQIEAVVISYAFAALYVSRCLMIFLMSAGPSYTKPV